MEWTMPGFAVEERLRSGGAAEIWRGRDLASGEVVVLKVLPAGDDLAGRLRSEAAAAAAIAGPHVLPVLDVVMSQGRAVIVMPHASGGSLHDLLAVRGTLPIAELVTTLVPIAGVLTAAHDRLLVHGDVTAANVLFTAEGCPMLADWGQAAALVDTAGRASATLAYADPRVLSGALPDTASDVFGLAAVAYAALAGRPPWTGPDDAAVLATALAGIRPAITRVAPLTPRRLVFALESALSPDPAARPAAGELGSALAQAADPAPVLLRAVSASDGPPPATAPVAGRAADAAAAAPAARRAPARGRALPMSVIAVVVTAVLAAAVWIGAAWGRSGPGPVALRSDPRPVGPPSSAGPASSAPAAANRVPADWLPVVAGLDRDRTRALRTRDPRLLGRVYAPGSAAAGADRATIEALLGRQLAERGLRDTVTAVHPLLVTAGTATVEVTESQTGYRIVSRRSGLTVALGQPQPEQDLRFGLTRTAAGWRIATVRDG